MANILITGGAGYIGTVISSFALQHGHNLKIIDSLWFKKDVPLYYISHANYKFVKGDIRNMSLMESILENVDYIIHTAAVVGKQASTKYPDLTYQVNHEASLNLISKAINHGVKGFIFFSTCSNYGISKGVATEITSLKPLSLYAETKVNVERYLMDKVESLDWVILRLSTVYGPSPRMRFDLTVNDFTLNAYMKKHLNIYLPYTYRPYIHINDVARVVLEMLQNFERTKNNVFNIGFNSENHQKIKIAEAVKKFVPSTRIEIVENKTDLRDYRVDFSKLQKFLNIKNKFDIEEGVKEVLELLKNQIISNPYENYYYNTKPDFGND